MSRRKTELKPTSPERAISTAKPTSSVGPSGNPPAALSAPNPAIADFGVRCLRLGLYAVFPVLFALMGAEFVRLEKGGIYLWDFATYWNQVQQLANFLKQGGSFWTVLKTVYKSTGDSLYNLAPSLPLVPFQFTGLDSRTAYIVSICMLYGGILYWVCCKLYSQCAEPKQRSWAVWAGGLVMLTTATLWWPVFRGFVDIIALASALAGVTMAIKAEGQQRSGRYYFLSGIFLAMAPVMRRAYSFYLLAFIVLFSIWILWRVIRCLPNRQHAWMQNWPMGLIYLGVATVFSLFPGFLIQSLKMDHAVHSSYKSNWPLWGEWLHMLGWFGIVPLLAATCGVYLLIEARKFRGAVVLGIGASALGTVLQMRTASLGEHHRYIMVAGFLIAMATALGAALSHWRTPVAKAFLSLALVSMFGTLADLHGAGSQGDWFPSMREFPYAKEYRTRPVWWLALFGFAGPRPIARNDIAELQRLYSYLDQICAKDPNPQVYLLASGVILGDGVISSSLMSPPGLKLQSANRFLPIHQVDSRDGVPKNILQANYVVTTFPLELHLKPESHKCVVVPWEQFRDGRGFARAFEKMSEEFHLENNVTVVLYRRTRLTTREDVAELESDLRKAGMIQ